MAAVRARPVGMENSRSTFPHIERLGTAVALLRSAPCLCNVTHSLHLGGAMLCRTRIRTPLPVRNECTSVTGDAFRYFRGACPPIPLAREDVLSPIRLVGEAIVACRTFNSPLLRRITSRDCVLDGEAKCRLRCS